MSVYSNWGGFILQEVQIELKEEEDEMIDEI